ncbi:four helix bundle protein [Roseibacillus persicicus]|uniref:Four helix bundle protein n=1 Tax=Roseibacillus persicicus TaxID=454148 RepID=A0A918WPU8_9BACT|nr:four helix bundle protein [Roseibacillus persicicus]MDQ8188773.1 four helix bundle protein [Roseibacillus persicicus]GHC62983.1 hypothetical protein GCM10007100_32940 [Roseibacillus persicicus]
MALDTKTFEELEAWKAGRKLRVFVFRQVVPSLISQKEFSLADQIKRASRSVTANIAEGHGRYHYRDNYKFCSNARGSLTETLDHLIVCEDDELIAPSIISEARTLFETALKILNGYMSWLERSAKIANAKPRP